MTRSQTVAAELSALLKARNHVLWIVTREEARAEQTAMLAAAAAAYVPYSWDVAQGIVDIAGNPQMIDYSGELKAAPPNPDPESLMKDPGKMLDSIAALARKLPKDAQRPADRRCWIMRDLPAWLSGPAGVVTLRQLRNLARLMPGVQAPQSPQAIIILSPSADIPPELANHCTVIDFPLPDRAEIAAILDAALSVLPPELQATAAPNGTREAAIDAAIGLSGEEAASCYAKSLVQLRRIDPISIAQEKKRVIAREGALEWCDALPGGMSTVGGLDNLKSWLMSRSTAYTKAARAYGVPPPKGVLLVGVQGCGKTLSAKAFATALGVPLLKYDPNAGKSKFVGESEQNTRRVIKVLDSVGPCVVWIDEIEKALQGATSNASDGGVSADALGTLLTWLQERQGEAFILATANDVSALPPELLRKGRFDEIFFVDLPNAAEREAILESALRQHKRADAQIDKRAVAQASDGFIGAEIAELVRESLFTAFADNSRQITTADLLAAAATTVPLSRTSAEKIEKLRAWASGRARPASAPAPETATREKPALRVLDLN